MLIRDPSAVYLGTSSTSFSIDKLGNRIFAQMKQEGALAAINGGAFNDDGTANSYIGSLPIGMVVSNGKILWDDGKSYDGFVGLTEDHTLVVLDTINRERVEALNIRDGCCFGPVLLTDGEQNQRVYDMDTSFNARTAIGQRADGTIIFLCIDGRQAGSMGATYAVTMELMQKLGAVNACNLDGGASTVMTYRDPSGEVVMCGSYALIQASPRRMPTFFMVRAAETED
jgi:exopolysaccharide biosynthesis protein